MLYNSLRVNVAKKFPKRYENLCSAEPYGTRSPTIALAVRMNIVYWVELIDIICNEIQ